MYNTQNRQLMQKETKNKKPISAWSKVPWSQSKMVPKQSVV